CKHFRDADGQLPPYETLQHIITTSLQESLAALQTDYVDVFMLHQADTAILNNKDVRRVFAELKQAGLIRAMGASTYSVEETTQAIETGWEVIQLPFNLMDQRQQQAFALAAAKGVG